VPFVQCSHTEWSSLFSLFSLVASPSRFVYVRARVRDACACLCVRACACVYVYIYIHMYICTRTCVCVCTCYAFIELPRCDYCPPHLYKWTFVGVPRWTTNPAPPTRVQMSVHVYTCAPNSPWSPPFSAEWKSGGGARGQGRLGRHCCCGHHCWLLAVWVNQVKIRHCEEMEEGEESVDGKCVGRSKKAYMAYM